MSSGNSSLGIIVGIDDSPAAQVAVRWAARDAELRKIPLTLVHAVSPEVATWLEVPLPPGVLRWQQDHGRHLIDDALKVVEQASLRAGPPTVHSEIVPAAAVPTLVDMSKDAVLMVVGCLGSGRWPGNSPSGISRSSSGRPPSASMGACRNFASRAAYSSTASLSGASVMRTTIQLMSDAYASSILGSTATELAEKAHCPVAVMRSKVDQPSARFPRSRRRSSRRRAMPPQAPGRLARGGCRFRS